VEISTEYALDEIPFSEMIFRSQGRDRNLYSFGRAPGNSGALLVCGDERNRRSRYSQVRHSIDRTRGTVVRAIRR
jgi:hypothetical protein